MISEVLLFGGTATTGPVVELPTPLGRDRRVFTRDSVAWPWVGLSAFPLCDRYSRGDNIGPWLEAFSKESMLRAWQQSWPTTPPPPLKQGYNLLRVWDYVTWPSTGWLPRTSAEWLRFLDYVGKRGWYVELTLMTDDLPERYAAAERLVNDLAAAKPANLVLEIGNEPNIHKNIDVARLRDVCEASGFLYASGLNDVPADEWFGTFLTAHTPRDDEWPRKCHDLLEYYNGGGPGAPTDPPHHVPCVADEPIRPDDAVQIWDGNFTLTAKDYRAYFAGCIVMGPGGTFHSDCGKWCSMPTAGESLCAANALWGATVFPTHISNVNYIRIDEHGNTSRTYVAENSMVRIRPQTLEAPEPGWTSLDTDGILWTRYTKGAPMGTRHVRLRGQPMTDGEENRVLDWLRAHGAQGNISLGNDTREELFVAWTAGPSEDDLRSGFVPHDAVYL